MLSFLKNKWIQLLLFGLVLFSLEKLLKQFEAARWLYTHFIYNPLQQVRVLLWKDVAFSVGDALYVFAALILVVAIVKIFSSIWGEKKPHIAGYLQTNFYRLCRLGMAIYALLVLFWGINYTQKPLLYAYYKDQIQYDSSVGHKRLAINYSVDTLLTIMDSLQYQLVATLPILENEALFAEKLVNASAEKYYQQLVAPKFISSELKPTSLGRYLQFIGIQGYFSPFSGEVHYTEDMFYLYRPFVFLHEMAHQKGIASELDANFLAYVLAMNTKDDVFIASARFELFTYMAGDLRRVDSLQYEDYYKNRLDAGVKAIIGKARAHREKYKDSAIRPYTMGLYDGFLKFFGQNDGLKSYSMMTYKVMLYRNRNLTIKEVLDP